METNVSNTSAPVRGTGIIRLRLSQVTETKKKDGFILKLQNKQTGSVHEFAFGTKENNTQTTYYTKVKSLAPDAKVGFESDLDLSAFEIIERPFVPTTGDKAGQTIMCKWLQLPRKA